MDLDLNSILSSTGAFLDNATQTAGQVAGLVDQGTEIAQQRVKAASAAADASAIKTQTEVDEVARQEASRKAIAARIGTDPSKIGWVIGQAADQIKQADAGLAQESEAIRQKDGVSFLTNPLGWMQAQLTVNENIANYNAYARDKNRAEETAAAATKLTTDAFQVSNALSSTATESYTNALKILGAHAYNMQASEAALQGVRWNMEGLMQVTNLGRDQLNALYSANHAIMQDKQYRTELQRLSLANAEFDLRKQAFNEKKDEDSLILRYVTNGYFNMTGKQMDPLSAKNALILYKNKEPNVQAYFESGLASSAVTNGQGTKPVFSLSAYKAADLVGTGKIQNVSPAMQQVGDQLITWRRQFESPAVQAQYSHDPKDKLGREIAFNKYAEDQKRLALGNVPVGSVFAPVPLNQVAKINPVMAALPLWKNVLEPASKTGVDLGDPNVVFGIVTNAMKEGKLSYPDAVDLSLMYAAGQEMNNQSRNFIAYGITPVRSYNAAVSLPGFIGKTTVNFTDQRTLATALNKASVQNMFSGSNGVRGDSLGAGMELGMPSMPSMPNISEDSLRFGSPIRSHMPEVKSTTLYGK